jgi:LytS/YehU family sensor histidine kinase
VPLSEELEFVQRYLAIEQIRFRDRLNVVWNVEPDAGTLAVPRFLLQPIIENALHHGIGRKADAGVLEIRAGVADGRLAVSICDDGPGFPEDWTEGVGLRNVRARLMLHYGPEATLRTSNRARGAAVELSIPRRARAEQAAEPPLT